MFTRLLGSGHVVKRAFLSIQRVALVQDLGLMCANLVNALLRLHCMHVLLAELQKRRLLQIYDSVAVGSCSGDLYVSLLYGLMA